MFWRRWVRSPTTRAPAVVARPRSSSRGSSPIQGRSGKRHADQEGPFQADGQFIAGKVESHVGGCNLLSLAILGHGARGCKPRFAVSRDGKTSTDVCPRHANPQAEFHEYGADDQAAVVAAEAEAVGDGAADAHLAGRVGHVVEVAGRVGRVVD